MTLMRLIAIKYFNCLTALIYFDTFSFTNAQIRTKQYNLIKYLPLTDRDSLYC